MAAADNAPTPIEEPEEPTIPRWKQLLLRARDEAPFLLRTFLLRTLASLYFPELPPWGRVVAAALPIVVKLLLRKRRRDD